MELSKERNIQIFGVNFKDKKTNASKFLKVLGDPYDYLAQDINGKESVNFGIYGIPESILVNNELEIVKKFIGPIDKQDLLNIKEIINPPTLSAVEHVGDPECDPLICHLVRYSSMYQTSTHRLINVSMLLASTHQCLIIMHQYMKN